MKFKELKTIWQKRLEDKDLYKHDSCSCFYINDKREIQSARLCMLLSDILKIIPDFSRYQDAEKYVEVATIETIPTANISALEDLDVYIKTKCSDNYFLSKCFFSDKNITKKDYTLIEKFEIKTVIFKEDFTDDAGVFSKCPTISIMYKNTFSDLLRLHKFAIDDHYNRFLIAGIAIGDIVVYVDGTIETKKLDLPSVRRFEPRFTNADDAVFYEAAITDALATGLLEVRKYNKA